MHKVREEHNDLELLRKRLQHTFASRDKMWKSNVLDRIRKAVSKSTGGDSIDEVLDRSLRTKNRRNPDLVTRAELTSTLRQLDVTWICLESIN